MNCVNCHEVLGGVQAGLFVRLDCIPYWFPWAYIAGGFRCLTQFRGLLFVLSSAGPEKDSSNPWCKICKNEISSATKASHRVSSKFVDVGANIPASDDGGRNVRHFQAPDTSGGCAICK